MMRATSGGPIAVYLAGLASPESREEGFVLACLVRVTINDFEAQVVLESSANFSLSAAA